MKALIDRYGYVPENCVWELTRACNLRCGHCGTAAGKPRPNELDTAEAIEVARQLVRLGNRLTTLSGGEPTLREDWPEIARTLVDAGVHVNMVTNGQGDGLELAVRAKDAGLANVAVSIDGLTETHDALRGHGAFDRAVATIRHLVQAGIWVDMMLTVNRKNLAELPDVWELAKRLGAQRLRVQLGKPMGNQTHREDLTLKPEDLLSLLPLLGRLAARQGPGVRIGDSIGYFSPEERVLRGRYCAQGHWTGCYAGVRAIGIQADGSVKGCLSLQPRAGETDRFIEGSLRRESLEAIWFRPGAFSYNRSFEQSSLKGACAKCSHAALCRGGATCVAYAYSGELGRDPMCYYHVAGLSEATRQRAWPISAPAATALLMVSLSGCGGDAENKADATGGSSSTGATGTTGSTGGSVSTVGGGGATRASGGAATSGTGGDVAMGYGVQEPTGGTGGQTGTTGGAAGARGGTTQTTGGTDPGTGGTGPGVGGNAGASGTVNTAGSAGATPIDCSTICCECEYGIIEPEAFRACCCENVCCECDYGIPPAGCC